MALRSTSAGVTGTGTTAAVPVPSGAAVDDIVVVFGFLRDNADTPTPPAGFTQKAIQNNTAASRGQLIMWWKRLTAADTGTHDFTWTNSAVYQFSSMAFSGRIRIGDPFSVSGTAINISTTALTQALTVVTTNPADDLVVGGSNHATDAGAWTPPSSMTETYDTSGTSTAYLNMNVQEAVAAGSYNKTVTGTGTTGSTYIKIISGGLMADRVTRRATTVSTALGAPSTPVTVTLPTHVSGDRILIACTGKSEAAGIPTIDQGFTLIKSGTGGDAVGGFGMFMAVYAKDAASSSETNPTLTASGTTPDDWLWTATSYAPGAGKTWLDAIGANVNWVELVSDTSKATDSVLGGTATAFTNQPTALDGLHIFVGADNDTGAALSSPTITMTGLSSGVVNTHSYTETSQGNDSAAASYSWEGFSGTGSAGAAITAPMSGFNNPSGILGVVNLRQGVGATTVNGGQVSETNTAQAGTLLVGIVVGGGLATVTNSALAGTLLVGIVVAGGGAATETNTAQAGVVVTGNIIAGGQASETGTAQAGATVGAALIAGGQVTETETAAAGVVTQGVTGGAVTVTATILGGSPVIVGGQASVTATVLAGTTGGIVVAGGAVTVTATVLAGSVVLGYTLTDTSNNVYAIMFSGDADLVWEPAVVPRPLLLANGEAQVSARKIDTVTIGVEGMATIADAVASTPRHRDRVLIGGVDWTFKDDFPIEVPDYELLEPFMYGDGGTLVLPQVNARYERLGAGRAGRLKRVRLGAKVVYQRVDDDPTSETYNEVVATDYKGFVLREGRRGDELALAVGGELLGRAALKWHPVPIFRKVRDAGIQLFNSAIGMGLRYTPRLQHIGIDLVSRGGMFEDEYLLDTVSQLTTGEGDQWTVMPTASGAYTALLKDRETVNATVYLDNEFASPDLGNDLAEKSNRVWINAVAPDGQRIMHASAPNLQATETPELPLVGGFPMTIGDLDADTSTGDGVTVLVWRLTFTGLLDKDDLPGGFDADVRDAVVDFQYSAGCANLAGSVDSETWDKLWDNFETGYSVQFAAQRPAVQDDAVQKFDRSGSGNIVGRHEGYDETAIVVDLPLDMGPVGSRRQAFKMAKHKLRPVGDEDWVGTITLTSGLIAGDHTPGDPLTADDVIPNRAVRPGWNVKVPHFPTIGDSTLFHVVACRVSDKGWAVELVVDTRARDAMEAWAVHQRNRANRYQPSRYLGGVRRRSIGVQDTVTPWDKIVGQTDRDWPLAAGEWTQIPVPAGQAGTVQRTEIVLDGAHEFAAMVTERPVPLGRLNRKVLPLAVPPSDPQQHHVDIAGGPTGGTFTLSGNSNTTAAITYGASAATVQAAIRTLGGAFSGATVTKSNSGDYTVTMPSALDLDVGTNSLTGGSPTISVTTTGPSAGPGTPWWGKPAIRSWLKKYGAQVSWGTYENPCGYDPYMKNHPQTGLATAAPLTGEFVDDDSWGYDCGLDGAVLYLYIWVGVANTLPRQRVFHQQLDGSGT